MDVIKSNGINLNQKALMENAIAQAETNAANIDYIAMMTDVELPEDNGTETEVE